MSRLRNFALALSLAALSFAPASAQTVYQSQQLQIQRGHILDGTWNVGALGTMTLATRPNNQLEGRLERNGVGGACHGEYGGNYFVILCTQQPQARGTVLLTGVAREVPPVATRARARVAVAASPAEMNGEIRLINSSRPAVEDPLTLRATRN